MKWLDIKPEINYNDPQELMEDLVQSFYNRSDRTKMDRFRDFRTTFYGSEAGKRVLYEILAWAGIYRPEISKIGEVDVYRVFEKIGRKSIALDILTVLSKEPRAEKDAVVHNKQEGANT